MKMGKSFNVTGLEGHNVTELLQATFDRGVNINHLFSFLTHELLF